MQLQPSYNRVCCYSRTPKEQRGRFLQWSTSVFGKRKQVLRWNIPVPVASCYTRASWFMAKPIVLNLTGWCNARRDVRADAAVTKVYLPDACCTQQGKFRRRRVCSRAPSSAQRQHTFQRLLDKELVETVTDGLCSSILLHFLLSHHARVNQCEMVQCMKPLQAASAGTSLGYLQYTEFNLDANYFLTVYRKYQAN